MLFILGGQQYLRSGILHKNSSETRNQLEKQITESEVGNSTNVYLLLKIYFSTN